MTGSALYAAGGGRFEERPLHAVAEESLESLKLGF
jgi:hypothetical protein